VVSAVLLTAIAGPILARILTGKIKSRLETANIHIRSLSVNLFTRSITLRDVDWDQKAKIKNIYATGIRILPFMRNRRLSIRRIVVEGGTLDIVRDTTQHKQQPDSIKLTGIDVDRITVSDIAVAIKHDTVTEYKGTVGVVLHYVALDSMAGFRELSSYTFRNLETSVKDFQIHYPGGLYVLKTKQISFNKELRELHIDSLELDPVPSKADWGNIVKGQDTRTVLKLGSIDAIGVTMGIHMNDTSVMAKSLTLNGWYLHCYKNKKFPFNRTKKFPLPMESFRAIGIGIEVDTIKLQKGTIVYEELPKDGFHDSWIKFDDVEAKISSVNNRSFENLSDYSTIRATGRVMKSGEVKAVFRLPLDPKKRYTAQGSIIHVPLKELNPLLKDLAFVEISSGKLNQMLFDFDYDDDSSHGSVHIDYEDLKILSLNKDSDHDVNAFKTMLVNTAVKNDKSLNGNIDVKRFKRKAVFHLWTMSLLDGIKSAVIPGNGEKKKK
jgi:hypothetical protein